MASAKKSINQQVHRRTQWLFLVPVQGVGFEDGEIDEMHLIEVTLIHRDKLLRSTKRFPVAKHHREKFDIGTGSDSGFEKATVFAVMWKTGVPDDIRQECLSTVSEELAIFSNYRMAHKRRHAPLIGVAGQHPQASASTAFLDPAERASQRESFLIKPQIILPFQKEATRSLGFKLLKKLLRLLRMNSAVSAGWRADLRRVAILIGQSYNTLDVPTAFLFQMIAMETLLTRQGDKYSTDLPERIEAFLGWVGLWKTEQYGERVTEVYKKRCALVHAGMIDKVSVEDLLFVDDIMINLLWNILSHAKTFRSKEDVIEFGKKVEAERILGIKPRVRPKSLQYISRRYSEQDKLEI